MHPCLTGLALVGIAHPFVLLDGDAVHLVVVLGAAAAVVQEVDVDAVNEPDRRAQGPASSLHRPGSTCRGRTAVACPPGPCSWASGRK
eukprot:7233310-Prymnesium_polylepis.1